jgi:hypothetical protein
MMPKIEITRPILFRWLIVACQAITFYVTYPLWQMRESPPLLPALSFLPSFDMGAMLIASVIAIVIFPRAGLIVHTILLLYAMLTDQTRIQPEFVSLLFLLWGTLPSHGAQTLARAHLIALWTWAGINKLLSPAFISSTGPGLMRPLGGDILPPEIIQLGGYIIAFSELSIGLLAIFPRTRKLAAVLAFGLHIGILGTLSPIGMNWNSAVWAWNFGLAFAGFALLWDWKTPLFATLRQSRAAVAIAALVVLVSPLGFYFGVVDAYLAHNLYSSNVPNASAPGSNPSMTWNILNVPMPPEHRIFEQFFALTCQEGTTMIISDSRWWFEQQGLGRRDIECPTQSAG